MELKCLCCENEFEGTISKDELGWHSVCDDCGSSFDVDVPEGRIVVAFAKPDYDAAEPYKIFEQDMPEEDICAYYAFDKPEEFVNRWYEMVENPDGMWYWVIDNGFEYVTMEKGRALVVSGACDPGDIEIFVEHWGIDAQPFIPKWEVLANKSRLIMKDAGAVLLNKSIEFEEKYVSAENESTTFYFKASKELLNSLRIGNYPDAVSMEISVEFPSNHIEPAYADVCVSPTNAEGSDYDWTDIDLPYDEIDALIALAHKSVVKDNRTVDMLLVDAGQRSELVHDEEFGKEIAFGIE